MSISVMAKVWQHELRGSEQTVMLALADHSDDYGGNVYPSVALVAWKAGISVRAVQRILSKFRQLHALIIEAEASARRPTLYRINLQVLPLKAPFVGDVKCSTALRSDTIDRFRQTCYWCKEKGDALNGPDSEPWHIDRILPGTKGGKYEPDNVLLSCGPCNRKRGAKLAGVPNSTLTGDTAMSQRGATATSAESSGTVNRTTKAAHAVSDELLKQGIRLAQIFGRKKINPADWSEKEQKSFKALTKRGPLDDDDLLMLERYYGSNRRKPDNICRRDLFTLLNNYQGEADRARDWCERHPVKGTRTVRNGSVPATDEPVEVDLEREARFEAAFSEWKTVGRPLGEECDAIFRKHGALVPA